MRYTGYYDTNVLRRLSEAYFINLIRLYWYKLKILNYITKLIMFPHNCVVTRNCITTKKWKKNEKLRIALMSPGRTKHICNLRWISILSKLEKSLKSLIYQKLQKFWFDLKVYILGTIEVLVLFDGLYLRNYKSFG